MQEQHACFNILKLVLAKVYFALHQSKNFVANFIFNGVLVKFVS